MLQHAQAPVLNQKNSNDGKIENLVKQAYHHGRLREGLFTAALRILERDGVDGLSMRSLAKEMGVTAAAPYSHFKSKNDILAKVAEHGFQMLAFTMIDRAAETTDPKGRLENLISAFIEFSQNEKHLFTVMFQRGSFDFKAEPTLAMTAGKSYGLIQTALRNMGIDAEAIPLKAMSLWAMMFGTAELLAQDKISFEMCGARSPRDFAERFLKTVAL